MIRVHTAVLVDDVKLSAEDFIVSCAVDQGWLLAHVESGVLSPQTDADMRMWRFSGTDLKRGRRLLELERQFDACPELAGLVVDLLEEIERVRTKLRRAGIQAD
jgi:chaperone modulatory protein CbpM